MAVEAVVAVIVEKLDSWLTQYSSLLDGHYDKILPIDGSLRELQGFLKDAEEKQEEDERIKEWLMDVRDIAFHVEEALAICIYKKAQQNIRNGFIKRYTSGLFADLFTNYKLNEHLARIQAQIHDISFRQSVYCIKKKGGKMKQISSGKSEILIRPTNCDPDWLEMVGFEENLKLLQTRLIGGDPHQSVVSVVGPAGIGKTRLVLQLYNTEVIRSHFDGQVWINVWPNHDDNRSILLELAKGLFRSDPRLRKLDEQELVRIFSEVEKDVNRRLLVVVDGVSTTNVLEILKSALPDLENGSRIVLITRYESIASHADSSGSPFSLQPLNEDDSWQLFLQRMSEANDVQQLEQFKRKILGICRGLPLAILLLGNLLSIKGLEFAGQLSKMYKPISFQLDHAYPQVGNLIGMLYNDLPFLLKLCFLYIGIFPIDFIISARRLVQLWIAEGYCVDQDDETAEVIAEKYLEELVHRCLLRVKERRRDGSIKKCQMLPILREVLISKAKEVFLFDYHPRDLSTSSSTSSVGSIHRLILHFDFVAISLEQCNESCLRSFMCFGSIDSKHFSEDFKKRAFRILGVLDLSYIYIHTLPKEIGELLHLRYLGLRKTYADINPLCICNLKNLQTLDLKGTTSQNRFPRNLIAQMQKLRHLYIDAYFRHDRFYLVEWRLQFLNPPTWEGSYQPEVIQTLWRLGIDKHSKIKDGWDKCTNLRKLGLTGYLASQLKAIAGWLSKLHHLESLRLKNIKVGVESFDYADAEKHTLKCILLSSPLKHNHANLHKLVLIGFTIEQLPDPNDFPPHLSYLELGIIKLEENPMCKLGKLPNLHTLVISVCKWAQMRELICSQGEFHRLEYLRMHYLEDLEEWKVEKGAFPNLLKLSLGNCDKLKVVPVGFCHLRSLAILNVSGMPWQFRCRVKNETGEDWEKISHIAQVITEE